MYFFAVSMKKRVIILVVVFFVLEPFGTAFAQSEDEALSKVVPERKKTFGNKCGNIKKHFYILIILLT